MHRFRVLWLIGLGACTTEPGDDSAAPAPAAAACPSLTAQDVVGRSWTFAYTAEYSAESGRTGGYTETVTAVTPDGDDALDIEVTQEWVVDFVDFPESTETRVITSRCDATGQTTTAVVGDWSYDNNGLPVSGRWTWDYTDGPFFPIGGGDFHDDVIGVFNDENTQEETAIEAAYDFVAGATAEVVTPAGTFTAVNYEWTDTVSGAAGFVLLAEGVGRVGSSEFEMTAYTP